MRRIRAFVIAVVTALAVFTYLSLPILREWYGQGVNLVVYAGLAVVAGAVTYSVVLGFAESDAGKGTKGQQAFREEMETVEAEAGADPEDDEEIEEMLEEL